MHEQPAAPDVVGQGYEAQEGVFEEGGAETPTLVRDVDTEPGEQCHGLRVAAGALPEAGGGLGGGELRHAPAVVGHDRRGVGLGDHEDPRGPGRTRLMGVTPQPVGLFGGPAGEAGDVVVVGQRFREPVATRQSAKGDGRAISRRRPGRSWARLALIRSHSPSASASSSKRSRSASTRRAASTALATTNSVRSVSVTATARSISSRSAAVVRSSSRLLRRRDSTVDMSEPPRQYVHCTATSATGQLFQPSARASQRARRSHERSQSRSCDSGDTPGIRSVANEYLGPKTSCVQGFRAWTGVYGGARNRYSADVADDRCPPYLPRDTDTVAVGDADEVVDEDDDDCGTGHRMQRTSRVERDQRASTPAGKGVLQSAHTPSYRSFMTVLTPRRRSCTRRCSRTAAPPWRRHATARPHAARRQVPPSTSAFSTAPSCRGAW